MKKKSSNSKLLWWIFIGWWWKPIVLCFVLMKKIFIILYEFINKLLVNKNSTSSNSELTTNNNIQSDSNADVDLMVEPIQDIAPVSSDTESETKETLLYTQPAFNLATFKESFDVKKINWNTKRNDIAYELQPTVLWDEGTENQQEFADSLLEQFCKRFAKYICWAIKDNIITLDEAYILIQDINYSIANNDNAKWWCNRKDTNDFTIALKLLEDDEITQSTVKKLRKLYN